MAEIPAAKIEMLLKALGEARSQADLRPLKDRPAAAMPNREASEIDQALARLDRTLAQGQPAKTRVPRGTYFNVVV